jgi:hypothetical protein
MLSRTFLRHFVRRTVEIWVVVRWDGNSKRGVGQNRPLRLVVSRVLVSHGIGGACPAGNYPQAGCRPSPSIALDILLFTLLKCKTTSIEKPFDQQVGNLADPDHHRRFAPANSAGEQGL